MIRKNNCICLCCGKVYTFCPTCSEYANKPVWMKIYHDENCKKIFSVATDYHAKEITKEKAKEILKTCDLTNKKEFNRTVLSIIDEILKEEKKTSNTISEKKENK